MIDAFSKFSTAVVTPYQLGRTVLKALVSRWFYTYRIPSKMHDNREKGFDNNIIQWICKKYGIMQSTKLYIPQGN